MHFRASLRTLPESDASLALPNCCSRVEAGAARRLLEEMRLETKLSSSALSLAASREASRGRPVEAKDATLRTVVAHREHKCAGQAPANAVPATHLYLEPSRTLTDPAAGTLQKEWVQRFDKTSRTGKVASGAIGFLYCEPYMHTSKRTRRLEGRANNSLIR